MREYEIKDGYVNGHYYSLKRRSREAVEAGAALYVVYVDGEFYCTCESRQQASEELALI